MSLTAAELTPEEPTWRWWNWRRLTYNLILIGAGFIGWLMMSISIWTTQPHLPPDQAGEVTLFTVIFQGMVFGAGLICANICFTGGPLLEMLLKPKPPRSYRRWAFGLGTAFSLLLILALPILSVVAAADIVLRGSLQ